MAGRLYTLNSNQLHPSEIGGRIYAIVAFPEIDDEARLERIGASIVAQTLRLSMKTSPETAPAWREAYGKFLIVSERDAKRDIRTFLRRARDRMMAAKMSLGFFQEGISGLPTKLPKSMRRHSLNQLTALVREEMGRPFSDLDNIENRVWRPSRPVIHLASAMQIAARAAEPQRDFPGYFIDNLEWRRQILALAELHEGLVLADRRFGIDADRLIRVRLI